MINEYRRGLKAAIKTMQRALSKHDLYSRKSEIIDGELHISIDDSVKRIKIISNIRRLRSKLRRLK